MNLTVALINEVFHQAENVTHLRDALKLARSMGAELAALPELPLNRWAPATKTSMHATRKHPVARDTRH